MNPEAQPNPREQMEVRLVAMLLGEASAFEQAELNAAVQQDPALAAFCEEMKRTLDLVKEASKKAPAAKASSPIEQPKLSAERRAKLLETFAQPRATAGAAKEAEAAEALPAEVAAKVTPLPKPAPKPRRRIRTLLELAAVLCIIAVLAGLMLPSLANAKKKAQRVTAASRMKQAELELSLAREETDRAISAESLQERQRGAEPSKDSKLADGNPFSVKPEPTVAAPAPPPAPKVFLPASTVGGDVALGQVVDGIVPATGAGPGDGVENRVFYGRFATADAAPKGKSAQPSADQWYFDYDSRKPKKEGVALNYAGGISEGKPAIVRLESNRRSDSPGEPATANYQRLAEPEQLGIARDEMGRKLAENGKLSAGSGHFEFGINAVEIRGGEVRDEKRVDAYGNGLAMGGRGGGGYGGFGGGGGGGNGRAGGQTEKYYTYSGLAKDKVVAGKPASHGWGEQDGKASADLFGSVQLPAGGAVAVNGVQPASGPVAGSTPGGAPTLGDVPSLGLGFQKGALFEDKLAANRPAESAPLPVKYPAPTMKGTPEDLSGVVAKLNADIAASKAQAEKPAAPAAGVELYDLNVSGQMQPATPPPAASPAGGIVYNINSAGSVDFSKNAGLVANQPQVSTYGYSARLPGNVETEKRIRSKDAELRQKADVAALTPVRPADPAVMPPPAVALPAIAGVSDSRSGIASASSTPAKPEPAIKDVTRLSGLDRMEKARRQIADAEVAGVSALKSEEAPSRLAREQAGRELAFKEVAAAEETKAKAAKQEEAAQKVPEHETRRWDATRGTATVLAHDLDGDLVSDGTRALERQKASGATARNRVVGEKYGMAVPVDQPVKLQTDLSTRAVDQLSVVAGTGKQKQTEELKRQSLETERMDEAKKLAEVELTKQLASKKEKEVEKVAPASPLQHQPEFQARENAFSTFSLNVSDVAFKTAAASLDAGALPDPNSVRVEEFINAFQYHDPAPARGAKLAFAWERVRYPFAHNRDLLRFAVQAAAQGREAQKPMNLVVLLDNSGSMERPDRVQITHAALRVLAEKLQAQDKISVIAFARTPRLWVDGQAGGQAKELMQTVGTLNPEGGTDLGAGLELAYQTALKHFLPKGNNRVILLTDGAANLGNVEPEDLKKRVVEHRQKGVALDCFGIGWEGYNDDLLETLSHNGDGRYSFLNDPEQSGPEFANQLAGALSVAACDVKAQVEFNPDRVTAWRQIGYAKHQLTKQQFRDNTVDAAEIAASESGNALYVIQVNPEGTGPLGVARIRFKDPATGEYLEKEWKLAYQASVPALDQAGPAMRLAGVAGAFGEWLARNPYAGEVNLAALPNFLNGVPETFAPDPRPKQLLTMIRQAMAIGK